MSALQMMLSFVNRPLNILWNTHTPKLTQFKVIIIIIIYLISVHFTISEAIYWLTLGYHYTASPIYTYMVTFFILLSHLSLTMSKYFPKFCMWTLLFSLSSYKPLFLFMLSQLSRINFNLQCLLSLQSNNICFAISSPNTRDIFSCQRSILLLSVAISLLITTLFHSFLFFDNILCTTSYPRTISSYAMSRFL
jgi:hypothetical protein